MKTWKIPVIWQEYGVMHIEAECLEKAKELALSNEAPLPDGYYVDSSMELDDESIIAEMNP